MHTVEAASSAAPRRLRLALACTLPLLGSGIVHAEEINSVVLRVNDEIATLHDFKERRDARLAAIAEARDLSAEDRRRYAEEAPRAAMREILDELLLLSRARQLVIEPGPAEIDEAIDSTRQRMGIPTEAAFRQALEASGMSLEDYRERTARSLKVNQVIGREVSSLVKVEDEWVQRYYREHPDEFRVPAKARLSELVVPTEKLSVSEARSIASAARAAIAGGEAMQAAADRLRALGEGRGAEIVGPVDLGWVEPGELAGALDAAAWALAPGALSEPIEARGGVHVVEMLERVESSLKPFTEVKEQIEGDEKERRRDEALRKYLGDLEKRAYLAEQIPVEAAGFREAGRSEENDPLDAFRSRRDPKREGPPAIDSMPVGTPPAVSATPPNR